MGDVPNPIFDVNGDPYSGAVLKAYLPGGTTSTSIAINSDGDSLQASITANANGIWEVSGNEIVPHIDRTHKWGIFADSTDAAANTPFYMGAFDNIDSSGELALSAKLNPLTVAVMIADVNFTTDDAGITSPETKEFSAGNGGGGSYDVALSSSVTANGRNIIESTAEPLISFVLRDGDISIISKQYNIPLTPSSASSALQIAIDRANALDLEFVDLAAGGYIASGLTGTDTVKFRGNGAIFGDINIRVLGQTAERYNLPSGFSSMPFDSYTVDAIGTASVDVDIEQLWLDNEVQGTIVYYVDWLVGSDANPGTQTNAPLKTINAAIQKGDVGIIKLISNIHYDGLDGFLPTRDVEISSFSGNEVIIRMGEDPAAYTFSVTATTTYEYETIISRQIRAVFDNTLPDGKGGYAEMELVADITTVNATPGSWFYDTGTTTLYVRMFTNRAPGTDLVMLTTSSNTLSGDQAMLLKNVKIEGGNDCFKAINTTGGTLVPRLYMQDCRMFFGQNFGLNSDGAKTYLERVEVADCNLDNLNYHDEGGTAAIALEIDVTSRGSGVRTQAAENNNASSMHENGVIVRINGDFYDSYGPNLPDTDAAMSLNVGVKCRDSVAPTAGFNVNFLNGQNSGGGIMYCHRCLSKGSITDYSTSISSILVAECSDQEVFLETTSSNSFVKQYWPESKI